MSSDHLVSKNPKNFKDPPMPKPQEETPSGHSMALKTDLPLILALSLLESWSNTSHCASGWLKNTQGKNEVIISTQTETTWNTLYYPPFYIFSYLYFYTYTCFISRCTFITIASSIFVNGQRVVRTQRAYGRPEKKCGHVATNTILHFLHALFLQFHASREEHA